ncbi:MAG: hypothetical protein ACTS5A_03670 [Candidatus Hodgkinia cicadicola]
MLRLGGNFTIRETIEAIVLHELMCTYGNLLNLPNLMLLRIKRLDSEFIETSGQIDLRDLN